MTKDQLQAFEAESLALADEETRQLYAGAIKSLKKLVLARLVDQRIRHILNDTTVDA